MLRLIFLILGAALFIALTIQLGMGEIVAMLRHLGWQFLTVTLLYGACQLARATALWGCLLARGTAAYRDLLWIRLSGEAVQFLTFTGPFLAEPAKAWLLKQRGVTTREAFAAVITEYLIYTFLSAGMTIVGLSYIRAHFALDGALATATRVIVFAMAAFLIVSAIAIVFRIYLIGRIIDGVSRLPFVRRHLRPDMEWINRMEDLLLAILRDRPLRLLAIMAVDLVAHGLLVFELYWILRALNLAFPAIYPFLVEATIKFVSLAFFYIPTQLGAAEGTYAVVFDVLGLATAAGFAVALVRRLRTLLVAGAGLIAMSWLSGPSKRWRG